MMNSRHGKFLALMMAATLAASACSKGEAESPAAGAGGRGDAPAAGGAGGAGGGRAGRGAGGPVPVTTTMVITKNVPREINAIGAAEASVIVAVRAQITGVLTSVNFKEGEDVTKGQ